MVEKRAHRRNKRNVHWRTCKYLICSEHLICNVGKFNLCNLFLSQAYMTETLYIMPGSDAQAFLGLDVKEEDKDDWFRFTFDLVNPSWLQLRVPVLWP